jgi:glycosyltransferase involved in cell wall biosynthesis
MKNYNVLVGGYDFEQKIHRGITFYGKALIKALYNDKNSISLLTGAKDIKEKELSLLEVMKQLNDPHYLDNKSKIKKFVKFLLNLNRYKIHQNRYVNLENKLQYLKYIENFYNIEHIYDLTTVHNRINLKRPMNIKLKTDIDKVILTSPTNVKFNVPMIQTLHDVIPITCIFHPPFDDSKIFYYRVKNMLKYSEKVISVSNFSKEECLKIFPQYEDKIVVTHQPIPIYEEDKQLAEDELVQLAVLKKYKIEKDNFLFYVGMLEKRKNIKNMIEAFLAVYEKIKMPLVLAGGIGYGEDEFRHYLYDKKLKKKIKYIGYINNIEKLVLLKNTRAFLFPSFSEGFGLPPLEAMLMGTPSLVSNVSSLPEVCGKASFYINPYNIKELADGIIEIVENEQVRAELKSNFNTQIDKFSFEAFRKKLSKIL